MKHQKLTIGFIHSAPRIYSIFNSVCLLLAFSVFFIACKPNSPEPTNSLQANAGPDQPVNVMQTVTLDGSASKDAENKPFQYQWEILKKPANSTVALTGPTTAKPTFIPDASGEYEIELTISNASGISKDKVLVTASQLQPITLNSDITTATVLEDRIQSPDFPDYIVPKDINVKAQLTLHPGVVIGFARDARFTVSDNGGVLIAKGTAERKVRFMGIEAKKGFWTGIMLNSGSTANLLEHVEILHAGSQTMLDATKMALAMFIESQLTIKNTSFTENDGYGLFVQEGAIIREFTANSFTHNSQAGIKLPADLVSKLDAASVFTGTNGRNVVEVVGSYLGTTTNKEEIQWNGFADKTPYRLLTTLYVRTGWKIAPQVTIETARDEAIVINESAYLIAQGTTDKRIRFTGAENSSGFWKGLLIHSKNDRNILQYADVLNGGSGTLVGDEKANVTLYGEGAYLTIRHTEISGSGGYGLLLSYGTRINEDFEKGSVFKNNRDGDVYSHFIPGANQVKIPSKR